MAPTPSSTVDGGARMPKKTPGFFANAMKRKHSYLQFGLMTGILLLSFRSLGQKYRLHDLQEDTAALKEEQQGLQNRISHIKQGLLDEAALDPTGRFAARLRRLFGEEDK